MFYLRKIFSVTCLILSLIVLLYIFYKSEIHWHGQKHSFYLPYYIFSTIALLFSLSTFYYSSFIKNYLIILFGSVVFSLYLFEIYLSFPKSSLASNKIETFKKENGYDYDLRDKSEIYEDLKKNNNKISMMVYPSLFFGKKINFFPLSNVSNSDTIYCNENGYYSIYKSDRYGFNNPDYEWDKAKIEYMLIGDSFVQGACVNRPDDMASILRNLSGKGVLNLGFGANGPLLEYATLREYITPNVKKIIWVYFEGNDLLNLNDNIKNDILKQYLENKSFTQNLKNQQKKINVTIDQLVKNQINHYEERLNRNNFFTKFKKIIKFYYIRTLYYNTKEPKLLPSFFEIIELANNLAQENNSKFYFVYIPEYSRYKFNKKFKNYLLIKEEIIKLGIPFIDIHEEVLKKEKNPLKLFPFEEAGHFNTDGYSLVSSKIFELTK
jgi:hypothetical protein